MCLPATLPRWSAPIRSSISSPRVKGRHLGVGLARRLAACMHDGACMEGGTAGGGGGFAERRPALAQGEVWHGAPRSRTLKQARQALSAHSGHRPHTAQQVTSVCVAVVCVMACAVQDGAGPAAQRYRGPVHAVRKILAQEGWRAFYKGLTPAIIGSGDSCARPRMQTRLASSPRQCARLYACTWPWPARHGSLVACTSARRQGLRAVHALCG